MDYQEAMRFIDETYMFGDKIDLENVTRLCAYLGNPQKGLKYIHVAGTNGKGSTSTMLSYILRYSGYRTGLYVSPYLEDFCERIQINNALISHEDVIAYSERLKETVDSIVADGHAYPSQFEVLTAMAFLYFKEKAVDFVVLEVGMGGRFDATNVIESCEAAVICSISFDHMQYLGSTLSEIAFEKAGIIKPGCDTSIYSGISDEIYQVFEKKAQEVGARLHRANERDIEILSQSLEGQVMRYNKEGSLLDLGEFRLSLLGIHQSFNVLNVLNTCEILKARGYNIGEASIREALMNVRFAGRFEVMRRDPAIVIDGGHNVEGISSFRENIKAYFEGRKAILFFGMLSDKEFDKSLDMLVSIAKEIFTLTPTDERGVDAKRMEEFIHDRYPEMAAKSLEGIADIGKNIDLSDKSALYAFTGSLYMLGEARAYLTSYLAENP
ncbi:MAG: bifunctional folylpolyglutamate synthase/dihydrofolate synthase [Eubacteriaceae bacterium]|jgi:dihydrofolate synthase/folylpolyglutamate synthase|nr:bifunctional folylpolyglutamate synthase/dihydrofolate synthase [Eubacteriaceae bacterium]